MHTNFYRRTRCPLCDSSQLAEKMVLDGLSIVSCVDCMFMFAGTIRSPSEIEAFYVEGYTDLRQRFGQEINALVNAQVLARMLPEASGKKLLDVGSGYGFLLSRLKGRGFSQLVGLELSRTESDFAQSHLHVQTVQSLDYFERGQFDVVTMFEVIEHIPDPINFLRHILRYVRPGGMVLIGTDNFESGVVRTLGTSFPKWIPDEHVSFFSPRTLRGLLEKDCELEIVEGYSFDPWELLARAMLFRFSGGKMGGFTYRFSPDLTHGSRRFKARWVRRIVNRAWAKRTLSKRLSGEMMYFNAKVPDERSNISGFTPPPPASGN